MAMLRSAVRRTIDGVHHHGRARRGDRPPRRSRRRARPAAGARCGPPASRAWPSWPGRRRWTTTVGEGQREPSRRQRTAVGARRSARAALRAAGLMSATGTPSPASLRNVAIDRPGCTAGLRPPGHGRRRGSTALSRSSTVIAIPKKRAGSHREGPARPRRPPRAPPRPGGRSAWRIGASADPASRVRSRGRPSPDSMAAMVRARSGVATTTWSMTDAPIRMIARRRRKRGWRDHGRSAGRRPSVIPASGAAASDPRPQTGFSAGSGRGRSRTSPTWLTPSLVERSEAGVSRTASGVGRDRDARPAGSRSGLDTELPAEERQHVGHRRPACAGLPCP